MTCRRALYRIAKGYQNYRSPLLLQLQRVLGISHVRVRDQQTRLSFRCLQGADRMLGEVYHQHIYDCPFTSIGSGNVVIDIGANHGFASCYFAAQGARVFAFEPSAGVFNLLVENILTNGLTDRIEAKQVAVGGADGRAVLYETSALGGGMSTIVESVASTAGVPYRDKSEVEVVSIHRILADPRCSSVRLLKLDCEGSELEILRGITSEERRRIDTLAVEFHPPAVSLQDLMNVLLQWERFHLSLPTNLEHSPSVLFAVNERVIRAWSAGAVA